MYLANTNVLHAQSVFQCNKSFIICVLNRQCYQEFSFLYSLICLDIFYFIFKVKTEEICEFENSMKSKCDFKKVFAPYYVMT